MNKKKVRVDTLMVDKGLATSRTRAQALLMAGKVRVDGVLVDKAGALVKPESVITVKEDLPFVGRGGVKLAGVLDELDVNVEGFVAVDVGSSTGGFTDCLLQRGARRVYAIDVGKGLIDIKLREDDRVVVLEGRNIRHMDPAEVVEKADLAVIDVSFISLEKVLAKVAELLKPSGSVLALIKPQFEVGKGEVGKGGVVRDPDKHRAVIERISRFAVDLGFDAGPVTESPITGAKGNREFWILLRSQTG